MPKLADGQDVVLLITHGSPAICLGRALTGDPTFMPRSSTAGCARYDLQQDGAYAHTSYRTDYLTNGDENNVRRRSFSLTCAVVFRS